MQQKAGRNLLLCQVISRYSLILITAFVGLNLSISAQDFGIEEEDSKPEAKEEVFYSDPYKLSLKIRPLSYLLVIPTLGQMGSFNARLDYAFGRQFTIGGEGNVFYLQPNPFTGSVMRSTMLSARLDLNYFFIKNAPIYRYAEGFHIGPYFKLKYESTFDPATFIPAYGISQLNSVSAMSGPLIGYQWVTDRFIIDQSLGFGAGLSINQVGLFIVPDIRLGLSIGTTLF